MNRNHDLEEIDAVIQAGPYQDTWESLAEHPIPGWYQRAKLGFFIHWGVFSVPAYLTEWYPRLMYYRQNPVYWHHRKKYGKDFEYHQFIPMFTADRFDPEQWLELPKSCGADFVMPVAEHHDGFKMYQSGLSHFNSMEMGPKRDVLGELRQSCQSRDIRFAASSHRAEHFWFMNGRAASGAEEEALRNFYGPSVSTTGKNTLPSLLKTAEGITPTKDWMEDWLLSSCEIVDRYQPALFYFDFWTAHEAFRPYMRKFLAYYYNRAALQGREVVSFYKEDAALCPCGVYVRERGQMDGISPCVWQCETSTAYNAWSYCTTNKFKQAEEIIRNMIDVWSKNGCMALNIGPKSDGTICDAEIHILKTISGWVQKNRESIWGTGPYRVFGEGKKQKSGSFQEKYHYTSHDFRFTYKLGVLYAFAMVPAGKTHFRIHEIAHRGACASKVTSVSLLGASVKVAFQARKTYLDLQLDQPIAGKLPVCFRITLA